MPRERSKTAPIFSYVTMLVPESRKERSIVSFVSSSLITIAITLIGVVVSIIDLSSNLVSTKEFIVPSLIILLAGIVLGVVFYGVSKFYRRQREERERALSEVREREKEFFQKIEPVILDLVR